MRSGSKFECRRRARRRALQALYQRHLTGPEASEILAQSHQAQDALHPLRPVLHPPHFEAKCHVAGYVQPGEEREALEDHTSPPIGTGHQLAVGVDAPSRRQLKPSYDLQ